MKFTIVAVSGIMLAIAGASPTLAETRTNDLIKSSPNYCPPNAINCTTPGYKPQHPRCYTIKVRDRNGEVRKKRVCRYS